MKTKATVLGVMAAVAAVAIFATSMAHAAQPNVTTTITVKGMHCQSCANKLVKKMNLVPGVAASQADAQKEIAIVTPKDTRRLPSPRAQWEAVEQAGYTPVRLAGPFGVFTAKPKR